MAEVVTHCIDVPGHLQRFYSKLERREGKKTAKVAAEKKLLEWICLMLRNGKSYEEMGETASAWGKPATRFGH